MDPAMYPLMHRIGPLGTDRVHFPPHRRFVFTYIWTDATLGLLTRAVSILLTQHPSASPDHGGTTHFFLRIPSLTGRAFTLPRDR